MTLVKRLAVTHVAICMAIGPRSVSVDFVSVVGEHGMSTLYPPGVDLYVVQPPCAATECGASRPEKAVAMVTTTIGTNRRIENGRRSFVMERLLVRSWEIRSPSKRA